jgi:hypothetical protein
MKKVLKKITDERGFKRKQKMENVIKYEGLNVES